MKSLQILALSIALAAVVPTVAQEAQQGGYFRMQLPSLLILPDRDAETPTADPLTTEQSLSRAARKGVPFDFPLSAQGGVAPYGWSVVTPNSANATIGGTSLVGTAQTNGTHDLSVLLTDGAGTERPVDVDLTVSSPTVAIPSTSYAIDTATSLAITPTYGNLVDGPQARTYALSGAPSGVSISDEGVVSGFPGAAGTYTATITVNDRDGASGASDPFNIVVTGYPTVDQSSDGRVSSVSGGTTQGTTNRIIGTSVRSSGLYHDPAFPKIQVVQGTTLQINYSEVISARRIYLGFGSPDANCWDGRNSGSIGIGAYSFDFYVSKDGTNWVKNSVGMVRTDITNPLCSSLGGSVYLDADKTAFKHARVIFTELKRWNSTSPLTLNVVRLRAHY